MNLGKDSHTEINSLKGPSKAGSYGYSRSRRLRDLRMNFEEGKIFKNNLDHLFFFIIIDYVDLKFP